jgi:hypothetical protein
MRRNAWKLTAIVLLAACKGDDVHGEDPEAHACEHAAEAGATVAAAATREDDAGASISPGDEPYTVTLTGGAGWLSIPTDVDTAALLFLGTADVVTGLYLDDGTEDLLPTGAPNETCPDDIPEHFDLDLEPGTWHLELGPSAVSEVWLMLVEGAHEHEE